MLAWIYPTHKDRPDERYSQRKQRLETPDDCLTPYAQQPCIVASRNTAARLFVRLRLASIALCFANPVTSAANAA